MTKIESGKVSLTEIEYDSKEFLRSVIIPARLKSADKNLRFDFFIDEMIPRRLYGDVGKIKHVLLKLLSNQPEHLL